MSVVYFIQAGGDAGPIKIGVAVDPWRRLCHLQTASHDVLAMLGMTAGDVAHERELHERFAIARLRGEWFTATPELLAYIKPHRVIPPEKRRKALGGALGAWALANGRTLGSIAENVDISQAQVSRLCSGKSRPSWDIVVRVYQTTNGEVSPNDWLTVDERLPSQTQPALQTRKLAA